MLSATPHLTVTHYFRDFCLGFLEEFCSKACSICGAGVCLDLRLRKVLDLPIFHGRCKGKVKHHFTFLPLFVAPGKWYGYPTIEKALCSIFKANVPNQAYEDWEADREAFLYPDSEVDDRRQKDIFRIPGKTTLHRWWKELEDGQEIWIERAASFRQFGSRQGWPGLLPACGPDGIVGEKRMCDLPDIPDPRPSVRSLVLLLLSLGQILLNRSFTSLPVSHLGIGLWFLEVQFWQRCLAWRCLFGRLIPCSFPNLIPNLEEMKHTPLPYAPKTSPP